MSKNSKHDATDSAIGFYFQACYALIILLDAGDDESVSVETADDVELTGKNPTLNQIKHTLGIPPALTIRNDGLWNTIGIWLKVFPTRRYYFVFVTCAEIPADSPLLALATPTGSRDAAIKLLVEEAERVVHAVEKASSPAARAQAAKADLPYRERLSPCREFLKLSAEDRMEFLKRLTITHRGFSATGLREEVQKRLGNYRKATRPQLAERLLQWWDRRVAQSLTGEDSRQITKDELLERLHAINDELSDDNLPDDFSLLEPPSLTAELGTTMEEQIKLVAGGDARLRRAAKARWRARNQRDRWIANNIGIATELAAFDRRLVECWNDRHGPLRDDCKNQKLNESQKTAKGLGLLDWSHNDASLAVPQPRPKWNKAFLTQGTYQQLADELKVGWHPEYQERLGKRAASSSTVGAPAPLAPPKTTKRGSVTRKRKAKA